MNPFALAQLASLAFCLLFGPAQPYKDPGIITTVAGTGTGSYGGDGGPATASALNQPRGLFVDTVYLWIADAGNQRIRRISLTTGTITTVAGNGAYGYGGDGLPATAAAFKQPQGLFVDPIHLWIADRDNSRIRRMSLATGTITTVVGMGTGTYGGDGGPATAATLYYPSGLFVDTTYLWIADTSNHRIRRMSLATGIITTVAGTGTGSYSGDGGQATSAELNSPCGSFVDSTHVWIADYSNHRIRRMSLANCTITTVAGNGAYSYGGDGGPATAATLREPRALFVDTTYLWIADWGNNRIRRMSLTTGIITTVAGMGTGTYGGDGGPATAAALKSPGGLFVDTNYLWVADLGNQRIRRMKLISGASVVGDPHFRGLAGGAYTIDLLADRCYNIFSSTAIQWNSCAVQPGHRHATYLGATAFQLGNHTLDLPLPTARTLCVVWDGQPLCATDPSAKAPVPTGNRGRFRLYRDSLALWTPCFRLLMQPQRRRRMIHMAAGAKEKKVRTHFNFMLLPTNHPDPSCAQAHGLLGITWGKPAHPTGRHGEGVLEGTLADYEVPNVWSSDFRFNRFNVIPHPPPPLILGAVRKDRARGPTGTCPRFEDRGGPSVWAHPSACPRK